MNRPRCNEFDYLHFLFASPAIFSCTEAAKVQPIKPDAPAHDSFSRLLTRLEPDPETLWQEARNLVVRSRGILVIDDTVLDKPYAKKIELVAPHWSGKHQKVVQGIDLVTLLWTDGDRKIPCDYRICDSDAKLSKNDHFWEMLLIAKGRGFQPEYVSFDGWYASLENLKRVRDHGWKWLTRFKKNRQINPDGTGLRALALCEIASTGTVVHLKGYGRIRVFKMVAKDGDIEYWGTNDLEMDELKRRQLAECAFGIENYHRELKQYCGAERSQSRSKQAQRNHIGLSLRAFLRFEHRFYTTGNSAHETKASIIREAIRKYLKRPYYDLAMRSTA
jgi:putative transposase